MSEDSLSPSSAARPIAKKAASTRRAQQAEARRLLKSAVGASTQLESDVRALVTMRAWEVLGHENLSVMWESEAGFKCPTHVQVLGVAAIADEGMNTTRGRARDGHGHTTTAVAKAIGLNISPSKGYSSMVAQILRQLDHGVPPGQVRKTSQTPHTNGIIDRYGTRARSQPRRIGKAADELVQEGFGIPRRLADEVAEIARQADVPKAEIYRQAVAEYLQRHYESRPTAQRRRRAS